MDKSIIPVFTGYFVQAKEALKEKYPPVYEKQYYDHVTKKFNPGEVSRTELGAESDIHIIGRLTTDRIDVLLVDVGGTQNEFPHITLSTVEGVLAKESNVELRNNREKIVPLDDYVRVREGAFLKGGGIDYGITFSLNTKHNRIVSGNQIDYEELKGREEIKPIEVNHDGIRFMAVGRYYEGNNQYIGHQLKDGDSKSVDYAAYQMSKLVPDNAVLVPVPGHHGTTEQTVILAKAISSYANIPVIDVLRGKERESQYEAKYNGRPLTTEQMGIRKIAEIPEGKIPVIVDGVVDTGTTARAAVEALNGKGIVLSFAMSDTLLKLNATEGKLDNGVKIKPSADVANGLKSRTMAMSDAFPDRLTVTPSPTTVSSARLSPHYIVSPLASTIDGANLRKKTEIIKQNSKKRDEILSLDKESQKEVREDITEMEDVEKVKDEVLEYFKKSIAREITGKPKSIGKLTQEGRIYLESISGLSMKEDVDFVLNPSDMTHIFNNHYGENEKDPGNNKPLTDNDIRNMVDVITNPETIIYLGFDLKTGNKTFMFLCKSVDGTYNLAEVYGDRKGNLTAKSFYNTKKDISRRAYELRGASQHSTSETSGVSPLIAKLPKMFELNKFSDENFHYLPEVNIEEDLEDDIDEEEDQTRSRGFHR